MKNTYLILLLLLSGQILYGQAKSSVDLSFDANRSYRLLIKNGEEDHLQTIIDVLDDAESPLMSFGLGLHYNQRLSRNLLIQSGIEYQRFGFQIKNQELRWGSEYNPATGEIIDDPSLPNSYTAKTLFRFWSVPLLFRYEFGLAKIQPFIEAGASFSFLQDVRSRTSLDNERPNTTTLSNDQNVVYSTFQLFAHVDIGINYQLQNNWQIFTSLGYNRSFSDTNQIDSPINQRQFSASVSLGVRRLLD
ncbi:MAG: outer membrane beta-barrel protein [Bacteroidota bacterium]